MVYFVDMLLLFVIGSVRLTAVRESSPVMMVKGLGLGHDIPLKGPKCISRVRFPYWIGPPPFPRKCFKGPRLLISNYLLTIPYE